LSEQKIAELENMRQNWYKPLKKYNDLIKEINEADA